MNEDNEIYHSIGQILLDVAPKDAKEIILEAEVSQENDHCKLLFDYIDINNNKNWFLPENAKIDSELLDLLVKLKAFYEYKKLYHEGNPWKGCIINLQLEAMKIKIDFNY